MVQISNKYAQGVIKKKVEWSIGEVLGYVWEGGRGEGRREERERERERGVQLCCN